MKNLAGILFIVLLQTTTTIGNDWNQYGGDNRFRIDNGGGEARIGHVAKRWSIHIGEGLSGLVTDGDTGYTLVLEDRGSDESQRGTRESIIAVDLNSGDEKWKHTYEAGWNDEQEAFSGRPRSPQATPAIVGNTLVTLGFTGKVHGLNRASGKLLWQLDAVKDCKAKPVQFGFSASVVPFGDRALVLLGGEQSGLLCLDAETGERIWNIPCGEASYATPVLWKHQEGIQVVFQDRDQLIGASPETGAVLWRFELPKRGLTNVPTPLPIGDASLIVSGQGIGGTRRLDVCLNKGKWLVEESWSNRTQFFYCNWLTNNGRLIGCDGKLLVVMDVETGGILAKWRGFADSNLIASDSHAWIVDGKGKLSCFEIGNERWTRQSSYQLLGGRYWTPPTMTENHCMYCRAGKQLTCFQWMQQSTSKSAAALPKLQGKVKEFKVRKPERSEEEVDFVQQVIDRFEKKGPAEAFGKYKAIRETHGQELSIANRRELFKLAAGEGYYEFARSVVADAKEDFANDQQVSLMADELLQLLRQPSRQVERRDNGLAYVEFAIENRSSEKIDTYVRGPETNRFSYGIPFPPGKLRIEKWPVGTRLFWAINDVPGDVVLKVEEELSGTTVEIVPDPGR